MVNEEDHIRLQCIFPGYQLNEAFVYINKVDDAIEDQLPYAFDEDLGYLTCCPTNIGTGMRASVMMHLPALTATGLPGITSAQQALLPLRTPGLDHIDVIVPDVEATTRFYMGLFNTELHAQAFQGGFRYFVLLNPLNERREVGYLAVGDARGRGTYIGHFCTSVYDWRRDSDAIFKAMGEEFASGGFGEFPGSTGFGGLFNDPDGIEIQFLPAPDTPTNKTGGFVSTNRLTSSVG